MGSAVFVELGKTGVRERLGQLLDDQPDSRRRPTGTALNALATVMVCITLLVAAALPAAAIAGVRANVHGTHHAHCDH